MSWQPSQRSSMYTDRAINIDTVCYKMLMGRESGSVHVYVFIFSRVPVYYAMKLVEHVHVLVLSFYLNFHP